MAEGGLGEWDSWRCCNEPKNTKQFCPPEGCPKSFGCAREHGWTPGMPSPNGCTGRKPMENYIPGEPAHEEAVPEVLALAVAEIKSLRAIVSEQKDMLGHYDARYAALTVQVEQAGDMVKARDAQLFELERQLKTRRNQDAAAQGFQIVPADPTPEMMRAYKNALRDEITGMPLQERMTAKERRGGIVVQWEKKAIARYKAMLAAAPVTSTERGV